jgi:hypothetical protein
MSKGIYPRDDEWREKYTSTLSHDHSVIVTDSPRTGTLVPYIGRVFRTQRELSRLVGVSPRTVTYWISMGYVNLVLKDEPKDSN